MTPTPSAADRALANLHEELSAICTDLCFRAAQLVRAERTNGFDVESKSSKTDLVTSLDTLSDSFIRDELARLRPSDAIVTEEADAIEGDSGYCWIADPIDGTTNFVYEYAPSAVSIAVQHHGQDVCAAVVIVDSLTTYSASVGGGAFRDDEPLVVNTPTDLLTSLVATGFGYDPVERRRQAVALSSIIEHIRDIRRSGSAASDLCFVAEGSVDAYYEFGVSVWDYAAGVIIAREAGAEVRSLDNSERLSNSVLCAHPSIIDELFELLQNAGAHPR